MKSLLLATAMILSAPIVIAQDCIDPTELAGQDGEREFTQSRHLNGVPRPLTSSGVVSFSDEEIIWSVTTPLTIVTRIAPEGMTQSIEGSNPEPIGAGGANNPLLSDSGLLDLIRGDLSQLDQRYDIVRADDDAGWSLDLTPKQDEMGEYVDRISISGCSAVDVISVFQSNADMISVAFQKDS